MAVFDLNQPASSLSEEDDVAASGSINTGFDSHAVSISSSINNGCDSFASNDDNASSSNILKTPKAVIHHEFIDTPGGSVYWVPRVSASVLPVLGTVYDSLDECIEVYRKYASEAGFGIRLSCQKRLKCGYVKQKYIVCNREGCPKEVWLNTLDPKKNDRQVRSSNFRVCGCKARVVFDMVPHTSKYTLTTFDVEHNHELDRVEYKHLSKAERKLTYNEQLFIIKAANANIGAVRAHNLYTGLKGSSSLVHGTQTEFKNFTRGVNCFIGDSDAQMLITRMEQRQEFTKDFSFDYFVEDAELCGLFWADEVAKCNYKEFGDIISFDATYKTNKYKTVFVPFTAIDNHRRSIIVGSGLLKKETAKAYGWLLRAFKKAFVRPPNVVVTDQDEAMRLVVVAEFPESKHRLCMWHIMQKIPANVSVFETIVFRIYDDTDCKDKFVAFKDVSSQIIMGPAFFVDSLLCGLMRTTSRLESENSFFSYFTSSGLTLVKFMLCYESAMERQRYTQEKLDHQSFDSFPALLTPLPIEVHAANVYTRSLFIRVQKEIVAGSWLCSITGMSLDEGCTVCIIDEEKIKHVGLPEVIDKESTSENVEEEINLHQKFTGHYKDLIPPDLRNKKNRYGEKNEAIEKLAMEASIILDSCVHMLRNNEPKLSVFVNKMKAIKSDLEAELPIVPTRTVSDFVQEFMGVKKPDKVKVKNPTGVRPKGREKQKRIKSGREISMKKSMKKSNKKKNGCGVCGSTAHNRRTCPRKNDVDVLYPAVVVPGGSDHVVVGLRDGTSGSVSV
ncbi:RNA-directed DNA polymerase, eukaryota [Tanacetum coccineum]